jgi:hypothetical protein
MSMSVLESVGQMSVEEKQQLFEILWLDLHREEVSAELARRTGRTAQGLNPPLPFEEVKARLRHRLDNEFADPLEQSSVPAWQQEELLRRDRMIETGREDPSPVHGEARSGRRCNFLPRTGSGTGPGVLGLPSRRNWRFANNRRTASDGLS